MPNRVSDLLRAERDPGLSPEDGPVPPCPLVPGNITPPPAAYEVNQLCAEDLLKEVEIARHCGDRSQLTMLVAQLVLAGVYPEKSGIGLSAEKMVECYGTYWHQYRPPTECPKCGVDLCNRRSGPPFKEEIGIVRHNRTEQLKCFACREIIWELPGMVPVTE